MLASLSNKKCWYCEARQERSDKHVDHFRPKGRVGEPGAKGHKGYWWLAFDWRNLRYSCQYCNMKRRDLTTSIVGGKSDRFPIRDESYRALSPGDVLGDELPVLLDPTERSDPSHVWFDPDGTAVATFEGDEYWWPNYRALKSIEIYHLNHTDLVEARLATCNDADQLVAQGDDAWSAVLRGSPSGTARFASITKAIQCGIAFDGEYSAAAGASYRRLSAGRPWLDALLSRA